MNDDSYFMIKPSYCEIQSLQIVGRELKEINESIYQFKNNTISINSEFFVKFNLYFNEDFSGNINERENIIYFMIHPDYMTSGGKAKFELEENKNEYLFLKASVNKWSKDFNIKNQLRNLKGNLLMSGSGNTNTEDEEGEELMEEIDDNVETPDVVEDPGTVETTVKGFNSRTIQGFCSIDSQYPIKITLSSENNNYFFDDRDIESCTNTISFIENEDLKFSNGFVPLIPCVILSGVSWRFNSNDPLYKQEWLVFSSTREKNERLISDLSTVPARLTLDSNNSTGVNNLYNSTFVFLQSSNADDILLENSIKSMIIDNILSIWSLSDINFNVNASNVILYKYKEYEYRFINNVLQIKNNNTWEETINEEDYNNFFQTQSLYNYEIIDENNNTIWHSSFFTYINGISYCSGVAYRYYVDRMLVSNNYQKISSAFSPYIMLRIKITGAVIDRIEIKKGYDIDEALNANSFYVLNKRLRNDVFTLTLPNNNDFTEIIKDNKEIYFVINSFHLNERNEYEHNEIEDIHQYFIRCPEKKNNIPSLNIEKGGVTIGGLSSGNTENPKFEVGPTYTTHFYGRVEIFPVGAIYLSTTDVNPDTYFYGTWIRWGSGRVPVGVDTSITSFNEVEKTGGTATVTLTSSQMPPHRHSIARTNSSGTETGACLTYNGTSTKRSWTALSGYSGGSGSTTTAAGTTQSHNNLQPYITCYMWKRIA